MMGMAIDREVASCGGVIRSSEVNFKAVFSFYIRMFDRGDFQRSKSGVEKWDIDSLGLNQNP